MAIKYLSIHTLNGLQELANDVVGLLERELYGCNVFVDKVYLYRNNYAKQRRSSWIWHYDNNPKEVFKTMIYLSDVDEYHAPFEYLTEPDGTGVVAAPTRYTQNCWVKPPNNSRITDKWMKALEKMGCKKTMALGPAGTATTFNVNSLHRANLPIKGYRDVVCLRTRPVIEKLPRYIDPAWTSGFEIGGVCPKNPAKLTAD